MRRGPCGGFAGGFYTTARLDSGRGEIGGATGATFNELGAGALGIAMAVAPVADVAFVVTAAAAGTTGCLVASCPFPVMASSFFFASTESEGAVGEALVEGDATDCGKLDGDKGAGVELRGGGSGCPEANAFTRSVSACKS